MKEDLTIQEAIKNLYNLLEFTDKEWEDGLKESEKKILSNYSRSIIQATKTIVGTKSPLIITYVLLKALKEYVKIGHETLKEITKSNE